MNKLISQGTPHFLLVDDHDEYRSMLVDYLQLQPWEYKEAANGREAVEACEEDLPEIIIMDLEMPVMDGFEATQRILDIHPSANIIILTQEDKFKINAQAEALGASECLCKFSIGHLRTILKMKFEERKVMAV